MSESGDCSICLDVRRNPAMTPCMHVFCRSCIGNWLDRHSNCPVCRHRITRGRRALTTVHDNTTPRRSSSAPAIATPPPRARPASPVAIPAVPVIGRSRAVTRPSSAATRAADAAVARAAATNEAENGVTAGNASTANRNIVPQHRRSEVRAALCTYRCPTSERQAFRRTGGLLLLLHLASAIITFIHLILIPLIQCG